MSYPAKIITSGQNPLFKHALRLQDEARYRQQQKRMILEGEHLCLAWFEQVLSRPTNEDAEKDAWVCVLLGEDAPESARRIATDISQKCGIELVYISTALAQSLSRVEQGVPLFACVPYPYLADAGLPVIKEDSVIFCGVQDPGNLGTALRSAVCAGVAHAVLLNGCCDAFSPKALRAGMGAQLRMQVYAKITWAHCRESVSVPIFAASPKGKQSLYEIDCRAPMALLFGNEGNGIPPDMLASLNTYFIPQRFANEGGIESLSIAAAVAVSCFERQRQRLIAR